MENTRFNFQRFSALLISVLIVGYLLIIGKSIISPLIFATLLSFLLKPLADKLEGWTGNRMWAIIISIIGLTLAVLAIIFSFGVQLGQIAGDFGNIQAQIGDGISKLFRWMGNILGMSADEVEVWLTENLASWANGPAQMLSSGLGNMFFVLGSVLLCLLYTFFLLLYRTSFYNFVLYQFDEDARKQGSIMIGRIEQVTKEYLNGLVLVIFILATLNSIGLYIIGIKLAVFWGVLGACLAIIPYIGTLLGALLPFTYALASFGFSWQPLAVIIFYIIVQSIEGNIITPKVIGKSVRVNPFVAIIALLIGGSIWGISGMILALPMVAIAKIVFSNIEILQAFSELFRDDFYEREHIFEEQYDHERYRLSNYFKRNNQKK